MRRFSLVALGLVALVGLACGDATEQAETAPPGRLASGTPILFVSIDTLRADRLPAYGYDKVDTPHLDALARDGIVFEHTYTVTPMTLPSHASLLTGTLPPEHGIRDNAGYRLEADELPYLPRLLKQEGYATGAAISAFVLRGETGFSTDFDFYDDEIAFKSWSQLGAVQRPGSETLDRALGWVETVQEQPFFLFLHFYEPHAPYDPPEPYASRYQSAYDAEVAEADALMGDLRRRLTELDLFDRALIVVTSDHGEGLGDHGDTEHGPLLYREVLEIPLIVKLPGNARAGSRVAEPASIVDIAPTILELLDIDPGVELAGRSLFDEAEDPRTIYSETYFPRLHFGWSELVSLIDFPLHYIHGPDPELYNLETDPAELENLVDTERRAYAELRRAVEDGDDGFKPPAEVDEETRKKLEALGYLASATTVPEGPLPDPKARIGAIRDFSSALRFYEAGQFAEAVPAFRGLLAKEPRMVDAWTYLGNALLRLDRPSEALEAFEKAMEYSGGSANAAFSAAAALVRLGRLDEAREHAELAATAQEAAWDLLAQIALAQNDLEAAERYVERAMETRGTRPGPIIAKAELALKRGQAGEALELIERAEREVAPQTDPQVYKGLYFVRGRALAETGDGEGAVRALSREIEIFPDSLQSYSNLALVLALSGQPREAVATLQSMTETNPNPAAYAEAVRALRLLGDPTSASRLLAQARNRWPQATALESL